MGRFFLIIGCAVVLLLSAALIVPVFIDWTQYRAQFETRASQLLGQEVEVAGNASVRLLPFPSVTFTDISIGNSDDKRYAHIDRLSLRSELLPLLRGQLVIFDVQVQAPHLSLRLDDEGQIDFDLPSESLLTIDKIALEHMRITQGQINFIYADQRPSMRLENIDAALSAQDLTGPWHIEGQTIFDNDPYQFLLTSSRLNDEGMPISLRLHRQGWKNSLLARGLLERVDNKVGFHGSTTWGALADWPDGGTASASLSRESYEPRNFMDSLIINAEIDVRGLNIHAETIRIQQNNVETGQLIIEGSGRLDLRNDPVFSLSATGRQLSSVYSPGNDVDKTPLEISQAKQAEQAIALKLEVAEFLSFMKNISLGSAQGTIKLSVPVVNIYDNLYRNINIDAHLQDGQWQIAQAQAQLPGNTQLELQGKILDARNEFEGELLLAARNPAQLAQWFGETSDTPISSLSRAGISGHFKISPTAQSIQSMEVILGETVLKGSFSRVLESNRADRITLDLNTPAITQPTINVLVLMLQQAYQHNTAQLGKSINMTIGFQADEVELGGIPGQDMKLSMTIDRYGFKIEKFEVSDDYGNQIEATIMLDPDMDIAHMNIELSGNQPLAPLAESFRFWPSMEPVSRFVHMAQSSLGALPDSKLSWRVYRENFADANRRIVKRYFLDVNAASPEFSVDVRGFVDYYKTGENIRKPLYVSYNGMIRSRDGARILMLSGFPMSPLGLIGSLTAKFEAQGAPHQGLQTRVTLEGQEEQLTLNGITTFVGDGVAFSGATHLVAADITPYLLTSNLILPEKNDALPVELTADMQVAGNTLRLSNLIAKTAHGDNRANIEVVTNSEGRPLVRGNIELVNYDLSRLFERVLSPEGVDFDSVDWRAAIFMEKPAYNFDTDLKIAIAQAAWKSFQLQDVSLRFLMRPTGLSLEDVNANFADMRLTAALNITNKDGEIVSRAQGSLNQIALSVPIEGQFANQVDGAGRMQFNIATNGHNWQEMLKNISGSGTVFADNLTIHALNPQALSQVTTENTIIDEDSDPLNLPDATQIQRHYHQQVVDRLAAQSFGPLDVSKNFAINEGVLTINDILAEDHGSILNARLNYSFPQNLVAADLRLTLAPGAFQNQTGSPIITLHLNHDNQKYSWATNMDTLDDYFIAHIVKTQQLQADFYRNVEIERQRMDIILHNLQ